MSLQEAPIAPEGEGCRAAELPEGELQRPRRGACGIGNVVDRQRQVQIGGDEGFRQPQMPGHGAAGAAAEEMRVIVRMRLDQAGHQRMLDLPVHQAGRPKAGVSGVDIRNQVQDQAAKRTAGTARQVERALEGQRSVGLDVEKPLQMLRQRGAPDLNQHLPRARLPDHRDGEVGVQHGSRIDARIVAVGSAGDRRVAEKRDLDQVEGVQLAGRDQCFGTVLQVVQRQGLADDAIMAGMHSALADDVQPVRAEDARDLFAGLVEVVAGKKWVSGEGGSYRRRSFIDVITTKLHRGSLAAFRIFVMADFFVFRIAKDFRG